MSQIVVTIKAATLKALDAAGSREARASEVLDTWAAAKSAKRPPPASPSKPLTPETTQAGETT